MAAGKRSQREWEVALDAMRDPIFIHDGDFRIARANKAYARAAGMDFREIIGRHYWEVFPKREGPLTECHQLIEDDGGDIHVEEVSVDSGEVYLSRGFVIRDDDGGYLCSVHIMEDITEKKRLQSALEESAQRYRTLFEGAPDAVIIADVGTEQLIDANPAAEHLTGRPRQELLMLHQSDLHPQDCHVCQTYMDGIKAAPKNDAYFPPVEIYVQHADGRRIPAEVSARLFQLGGHTVVQYMFRDISARRQVEDELRKTGDKLSLSLRLLKEVVESVPIRVFWKDKQLRYLGCNTLFAEDSGLASPDELLGKTDFDMGWEEQARRYRQDDMRVMESGIPKLGYEEPQTTPDGDTIWLRTSKVPLYDDNHQVVGVLGIYDDITDQKLAQEQLMRSEGRLKEAQEVAGLGSWELDLVKNGLWWSDENYHIFAAEPGTKNTYETFLERVHPDDRDLVNQAYTQSVENKTSYDIEHRLLLPDGSVRWVNERCKTYYDDNEKPLRSSGTTLDITERKRVENRLARLGRVLGSSTNEIYVFDAATLKFVEVNEGACRNLGYSMDELARLTPLELKPEFSAEQFDKLIEPLRNGEREMEVFETVHLRKDCSRYPVEVHLQYSAAEQPPVFLAVINDISERRKVMEQLQRSEANLAEAQRIGQFGSWEFDLVDNKLYWSDEVYRIFEIDPERFDPTYELVLDIVHPDDRERVDQAYHESVEQRSAYGIVYRLLMMDDRIKYVREVCETHYDSDGRPQRSVGTVQDITAQQLAEQALNRSNRALRTLSSCNAVLIHAVEEDKLLENMCRVITETGGYYFAWIGFVEDNEDKAVFPMAHAGYEHGYLDTLKITYADTERGRGPVGRAIRSSEPVVVRNVVSDPSFAPWRKEALERGYASVLALPLHENGNVFGSLSIYSAESDAFDEDETRLLTELADDLAFGIMSVRARSERDHLQAANLEVMQRHKQVLVDAIRAIAMTVEKRDPYTAGHQQRVADLAVAIGRELGLDDDRLEGLGLGATIHDLGKIYVPAEILNRPGRLSEAEFEIIKSHSQVGFDIIKDVTFPWPVGEMVLQHHERLDGSGYPQGLKGDEIILEARILAVADVVEAITAHRPYRPARGLQAALAEIEASRGTLYDTAVVDACLKLIRNKEFSFVGEQGGM
jgi:PAS domain S-box-containing protein